jgi:hypothetical protein
MSDALRILKVHEVNKTDMVERFLLQMLITHDWGEEFNNVLIESDDESTSIHMSNYLYKIGLLQFNHDETNDYKYDISAKGRKYLEQQKGE